jgi:hypothetical protein
MRGSFFRGRCRGDVGSWGGRGELGWVVLGKESRVGTGGSEEGEKSGGRWSLGRKADWEREEAENGSVKRTGAEVACLCALSWLRLQPIQSGVCLRQTAGEYFQAGCTLYEDPALSGAVSTLFPLRRASAAALALQATLQRQRGVDRIRRAPARRHCP